MKMKAILLSMLMLTTPCIAYGAEQEAPVYQESWDQIINSLEDSEHGGIYIDNGVLHIKPVADTPIDSTLYLAAAAENGVQIDPVATYSIEELNAAKKLISDNRDTLDVNSIATRNKYNAIIVTSPNWTDSKKDAVKAIAGIDNIIFEIRENGNDIDYFPAPTTHYEIKLDLPEIIISDRTEAMTSAAFESNGVYLLPLSEMLTLSGFPAAVDAKTQTMTATIGDTPIVVDAKTSTVSINGVQRHLLVKPIFKNGHCYLAYNDLKAFVFIKKAYEKDVSFFWELYEHPDEMEKQLNALPAKNVYTFTADSGTYEKNNIPHKLSGGIVHQKGEHMMIPIRTIAEMMSDHATVVWDDTTKTASIRYADRTFAFSYETNALKTGSPAFVLPAPLELSNGRLYVPEIDCLAIQYGMGNKMDTFDLYQESETTLHMRFAASSI